MSSLLHITVVIGCLVSFFFSPVEAAPAVAFPISAQVPKLAAIGQPYVFQFSAGTFTATGNLSYYLENAPQWLSLDSDSRTLTGIPQTSGTTTVQVWAQDGAGSIQSTFSLVVVSGSLPLATVNVTDQLERDGYLSSQDALALYTSETFTIAFPETSSFAASSPLWYASTSIDRSPLPSWIQFDAASLTFSGVAPPLSTWPQSFGVRLIASQVPGYEGSSIEFFLTVSEHRFVFQNLVSGTSFTPGLQLDYHSLLDDLRLDNNKPLAASIANATVLGPPWLSIDQTSLLLQGVAPINTTSFTTNINVTDIYGDLAETTINFSPSGLSPSSSLFTTSIGTLTATKGTFFVHQFDSSLFSDPDVSTSVSFQEEAPWLFYDAATRTLNGKVPDDNSAAYLMGSLTAVSSINNVTQTEPFELAIVGASPTSSTMGGSSSSTATHSTPNMSSGVSFGSIFGQRSRHELSRGSLAAAIVVPILVVLVIICLLVICCYRRRQSRQDDVEKDKKSQYRKLAGKKISGPFLCAGAVGHDRNVGDKRMNTSGWRARVQGVSRFGHRLVSRINNGSEPRNPTEPTLKTSRTDEVARSLSPSEVAVLKSHDRTSSGSAALRSHTPHDSMKLPTVIARKAIVRAASPSIPPIPPLPPMARTRWQPARLDGIHSSAESVTDLLDMANTDSKPQRAGPEAAGALVPIRTPAVALSESQRRRSARLVPGSSTQTRSSSEGLGMQLDTRPFDVRRQSYITRRASSASRPLFTAERSHESPQSARGMSFRSSTRRRLTGRSSSRPASLTSSNSFWEAQLHFPRVVGGIDEIHDDESSSTWEDVSDDDDDDEGGVEDSIEDVPPARTPRFAWRVGPGVGASSSSSETRVTDVTPRRSTARHAGFANTGGGPVHDSIDENMTDARPDSPTVVFRRSSRNNGSAVGTDDDRSSVGGKAFL